MSDQDWTCVPLTDLVDINPESLSNSTPAGSRFRYIDISSVQAGVIDWQTVLECSFATAPSRARRIVRPKDSLFCTVRPSLQAHAYAAWNDQDGYVSSTGFAVLRPSRSDPRFIFHKLFSEELARQVRQSEVGSSYPAVNEGELGRMFVSVPLTIEEQTRIAEVLDTLDEAIREAEAVIAKLRQVKAGLLHDLLTRGLDEHGHLRDPIRHPDQFQNSPLGLIPKAWDILSFTELCSFPTGQVDPRRSPYRNWPLIAPDHIESETGRLLKLETAAQQGAISGKYVFESEDVIYSKIRPYLRKAVLANQNGLCSADMYPLRASTRMNSHFLLMIVLGEAFSRFAVSVSQRSGFPKINRDELAEYSLAVPMKEEQDRAAAVASTFESRLEAEEAQLSKFYSLKRGLSHDLLTGWKRVKFTSQ